MLPSDQSTRRRKLLELFASGMISEDELQAALQTGSSSINSAGNDTATGTDADTGTDTDTGPQSFTGQHTIPPREQRVLAESSGASHASVPSKKEALVSASESAPVENMSPSFTGRQTWIPEGTVNVATSETEIESAPALGQIAGRYDLLERLGGGGMGEVFRGYDRPLKRRVAIKRIRASLVSDPKTLQRFFIEAQAAVKVKHPHIVEVYHLDQDATGPYQVLELIEGESLAKRISKGSIPWSEAIELLLPVFEALTHAHQQDVIHRDIKPGNILITQNGRAKLADFGIALQLDGAANTATGASMGTLAYVAPEQLRDASRADPRSDVFSLASTLYESVTGQIPQPFKKSLLPIEIREIVTKARAEDPDERFQSVADFGLALRALLNFPATDEFKQVERSQSPISVPPVNLNQSLSLSNSSATSPPLISSHTDLRVQGPTNQLDGNSVLWKFGQLTSISFVGMLARSISYQIVWITTASLEKIFLTVPGSRPEFSFLPEFRNPSHFGSGRATGGINVVAVIWGVTDLIMLWAVCGPLDRGLRRRLGSRQHLRISILIAAIIGMKACTTKLLTFRPAGSFEDFLSTQIFTFLFAFCSFAPLLWWLRDPEGKWRTGWLVWGRAIAILVVTQIFLNILTVNSGVPNYVAISLFASLMIARIWIVYFEIACVRIMDTVWKDNSPLTYRQTLLTGGITLLSFIAGQFFGLGVLILFDSDEPIPVVLSQCVAIPVWILTYYFIRRKVNYRGPITS